MWCGPWVIALLLGTTYDTAYRMVLADVRRLRAMAVHVDADREQEVPDPEHVRRAKPASVSGTYPHQIARLLTRHGIPCDFTDTREAPPTVLRFIRERPKGCFLIHASNHWLVVQRGKMYNSHFDPVPVETAPRYRKSKVLFWAEVAPR